MISLNTMDLVSQLNEIWSGIDKSTGNVEHFVERFKFVYLKMDPSIENDREAIQLVRTIRRDIGEEIKGKTGFLVAFLALVREFLKLLFGIKNKQDHLDALVLIERTATTRIGFLHSDALLANKRQTRRPAPRPPQPPTINEMTTAKVNDMLRSDPVSPLSTSARSDCTEEAPSGSDLRKRNPSAGLEGLELRPLA